MPNAQTNARSDSTVQSPDTVLLINILHRFADSQILWAVRIIRLALHLNSNNFNGLIPRAQATTKSTREDFLHTAKLLSVLLDVYEDAALPIVPELGEIAVQKPFVHLVHAHRVMAGRLTAASERRSVLSASKITPRAGSL